jgi:hypothetical protein
MVFYRHWQLWPCLITFVVSTTDFGNFSHLVVLDHDYRQVVTSSTDEQKRRYFGSKHMQSARLLIAEP